MSSMKKENICLYFKYLHRILTDQLFSFQEFRLKGIYFEEILWLDKSGLESRHKAVLAKENATAKTEIRAKSNKRTELEVGGRCSFLQNIDFDFCQIRDLQPASCALERPYPAAGKVQFQEPSSQVVGKN